MFAGSVIAIGSDFGLLRALMNYDHDSEISCEPEADSAFSPWRIFIVNRSDAAKYRHAAPFWSA